MELLEAIKDRRSVGKVKSDAVERSLIEAILEAGTYAPNHFRTEPWRFFVLTGEGRKGLADTLVEIAKESMDSPDTAENVRKLEGVAQKPYRAPVIITVACQTSDHPRAFPIEELGAVNAAIQNMLLVAHSLGLGAIWRTGAPAYHPKMKQFFGLEKKDEVLGFIYLGYPEIAQPSVPKTPFTEKTVWLEG